MTCVCREPESEDDVVVARCQVDRKHQLFVVLWFFIIVVSVIDGYLVLEYRSYLTELNPQGRLLIALNDGQVWYLLIAKSLGTAMAGTVLLIIHHHNAGVATAMAFVLAALQFGLLLFLLLR